MQLRMTRTLNTFPFLVPAYRGDSQTSGDQPRQQVTQEKETGITCWELDWDIGVFRESQNCVQFQFLSLNQLQKQCVSQFTQSLHCYPSPRAWSVDSPEGPWAQISAFLANFQEKALIRKLTHKIANGSSPTLQVISAACEAFLWEIGVDSKGINLQLTSVLSAHSLKPYPRILGFYNLPLRDPVSTFG